jgi:hypothetical protein
MFCVLKNIYILNNFLLMYLGKKKIQVKYRIQFGEYTKEHSITFEEAVGVWHTFYMPIDFNLEFFFF